MYRNVLLEASEGRDYKRQMQNVFLKHQRNTLKNFNV